MATWYPEGGFYERQAQQGEDQWADGAEFDAIEAPSEDTKFSSTDVSFLTLTKPASYSF